MADHPITPSASETQSYAHKTYSANLASIVETALAPLTSFKEILYCMEAQEAISPADYAAVVESLLNDARRTLVAMRDPLEAQVGRIFFLRATATNPGAETGEIVGVEIEEAARQGRR